MGGGVASRLLVPKGLELGELKSLALGACEGKLVGDSKGVWSASFLDT